VRQIPKSVVREIRTLRSEGVGTTFMVVPSTRRESGDGCPYRDFFNKILDWKKTTQSTFSVAIEDCVMC